MSLHRDAALRTDKVSATTYTLRSGDIVTAKTADWPTQYVNRTQAERAAAKIPGAEVIQRGRPFYVRVGRHIGVEPSSQIDYIP